ncbi:hypothetical protein OCF84_02950 [Shewanella xiamenensis]|uniref:CU044_2847 family protein n=1 Tax=Shewanella xiamenensis TaxID=332186 RepID=UPI001559F740|nr:CU044_2847 family protein [Shewanella xiamenensis]MBW0278875.1 hypothetical protein [Shewanella xiamenensis]MCR4534238.1 hypothetical protein [Shewanella xiamenensis]MCT8871255.1 hypothetical protein [Shewanella xiamenensis]UWH41558.1 hypothetical protein KXJ80_20380 [Shewanella xiamenensis]WHF56245.1 hypothetical protein OCF84_02950 [Shewanella xiamenensis]
MLKIVKLNDGLEVEIEINEKQAREISSTKIVDSSIQEIQEILSRVIKPISNTYKELNKEVNISETKVTLGVKLGIEGNFFIAKSSTEAHLQIEITLR